MKRIIFVLCCFCLPLFTLLTGCGGSSSSSGGTTNAGAPTVSSISPTTVAAGSAATTLTVNGAGFLSTTTVQVNGVAEATTYVSSTQVTAVVPASQLASGAQLSVVALNGSASSGSGTAVNLQVTNPVPTITQLSPTTILADTASLVVTVTGTGFVPTTTIAVNGSARTSTYVSATQMTFALAASDVAASGTLSITAVNAAPGGGSSAVSTIAVNNPVPGTGALSSRAVLTNVTTPPSITVTGTNYVPGSTVLFSGAARATTYISATQISFQLTAADVATVGYFPIAIQNPAPGGGTSSAGYLYILQPTPTPVITSVSPVSFVAGSGPSYIYIYGSNLYQQIGTNYYYIPTTIFWNGTALTGGMSIGLGASPSLFAKVPANLLTTAGTATITVSSSISTPAVSNSLTVNIVPPPAPTLTSISPSAGPINTDTAITLSGTGFTSSSTVALNGVTIPSNYSSSTYLTATIPASALTTPGNANITVTTPAPGGGTTAPLAFTAYLGLVNNDMVYNSADGLLYVSVPGSVAKMGNSIVSVDPVTGNVTRQIWVGSNPNKLALSSDGKQIFVGLDGAGAAAQVNLATGQVVSQFSLGGGTGVYNAPYTAKYLAAVPGQPNSVAVVSNGTGVAIYDSGVARAKNSSSLGFGAGPIAFGSSASTLYTASGSTVYRLTIDSTGVAAGTSIYSGSYSSLNYIQYDNGQIYLNSGAVLNASTGALLGTFYSSASTAAFGPVAPDSTLGLAFVGAGYISTNSPQVLAFNSSTFNPAGSISVSGMNNNSYPYNFVKILRWGQNGLALNTSTQIYLFQSAIVKDLSSTPADLSVTLGAPATATTGSPISYTATVQNLGSNQAQGATLALTLDASLIVNSVTPSQGTCGTGNAFTCDLGTLANGSSAAVSISATPTTAATVKSIASVSSVSYDPTASNNQASASTTVTGSFYAPVPAVTTISPSFIQAGSATFTLTVNGSGFNSSSVVNLNGTALTTTYVSATQLTASVDSSAIVNYGWAPVTVSNPFPGGGISKVAPLTIYSIVSLAPNQIQFDPYSQLFYATLPSASTSPAGNSLVTVNPVTGAIGTPIPLGSEPNAMAESGDGNYLYVGLNGSKSLAQFNLASHTLVQTFPLLDSRYSPPTSFAATSLAVMPGTDTTLAVNNSGSDGILDISGTTATFRPNFAGDSFPTFPDATHLYTYDNYSTGAEFYRYSINANGLTLIDGSTLNGIGGFGGSFKIANGLLYGASGGIANPTTTPPTQIASLALPDFYQSGSSPEGVTVVPDPSLKKEFLMLENLAGTSAYGLVRYDTTTFLPEATLLMPSSVANFSSLWTMQRWGQDGLALLTTGQNYSTNQTVAIFILLRGPFVTPQLLTQNTAASIASSSANSIAHGAGNTLLTLTGSNFLPGVAVTWNGSYRTTTIVDSTHVTVAIPASDLAAAGSGSLVATNPGAAASTALTVTIN